MDIYEILTQIGISVFSITLSLYIGKRYIENSHLIEDILSDTIQNIISDAQTNESMQKNLYTIGAIMGNGIAAGSGMKSIGRGGGKLSLNGIIAEIASNFIANQKSSPSPLIPTPSPQDLTVKKVSDKW